MVELEDQEQSLTESEFQEFEKLFVRSVPRAFKAHYMKANGGHTSEADNEAGRFGLPVNGFDSIKYGKIPIEQLIDSFGDITPNEFGAWKKFEFIPFACDDGGNSYFVSLRDDDYGCIYIFDWNAGNIAFVEPSFEVFLNELFKERP